MADGPEDRSVPSVAAIVAILGLAATLVGAALGFHGRVMADTNQIVNNEMRHMVTRDELSELRRVAEAIAHERHFALIRRLDSIEAKITRIERKVGVQ